MRTSSLLLGFWYIGFAETVRLGKMQTSLLFRSAFSIFGPDCEEETKEK
jgi:hypothetical protein